VRFPEAFEAEAAALGDALARTAVGVLPPFEVRRVLLDVGGHAETRAVLLGGPAARAAVLLARERVEAAGTPLSGLEAALRYAALAPVVAAAVRRPETPPVTASDRIDAVLTHRLFGSLAFVLVMTLVFVAIFSWAGPLMDWISEGVFGALASAIVGSGALGGGALESLVVQGVVGGVGSVLVFLPQILILFAFLAVLEDCGYMARAAFVMDRLLRWCGLSGKSFLPMLSSFACAVPGILATRTIETRRDRLATVLVAPLMSCSARIPVYLLMVMAFVPAGTVLGIVDSRALVFTGLYLVGILVAIPVAFLLRRTVLRGEPTPFLLELPPYKLPSLRAVGHRMAVAGREFIVRASTLILATSVVVWALSYFPRDPAVGESLAREESALAAARDAAVARAPTPEARAEADAAHAAALEGARTRAEGEWMRRSWLGRAGRAVEPVFAPIGWDWKVSVAVIASFPAREVVVGTLGVLYDVGDPGDDDATLRERIRAARWEDGPRKGLPVFDLASALALAVFFALCMQCVSTLAVMRRETGGWRWPLFAFAYLTALAYVGALATATLVRAFS
jgi:ferrous iron transport protein B